MRFRKSIALFLTVAVACYLILFPFAPVAQGHDCGDCEYWSSSAQACVSCSPCCSGNCCGSGDDTCCGGSCCSNVCCNDVCCDAGQICCNGQCEYVGTCTGGPYTAYYCGCFSGNGSGWNECSVKKVYHVCEGGTCGCTDSNRQAWAIGTSYSSRETDPGRRCNGASYCGVTNVRGKNKIGDSPCFVIYYGCS